MAMTWGLVKQVIESINTSRETEIRRFIEDGES